MDLECDSIPLMRQLARMANIPDGLCRRMVLVLDVNDVPRLFVEGFLAKAEEQLIPTQLTVEEKPLVVTTTTMQNERWATHQPLKRHN